MNTRVDDRVRVTVHTMNAGRADEFERMFFHCHNGHDLGSIPLDAVRAKGARMDFECLHYVCKDERKAASA